MVQRLARVTILLALNVAALYVLWSIWPRGGDAPGPDVAAAELEASLSPSIAPPRRAPPPRKDGPLRNAEASVRATVARWVESARELSKNKVHAGNAAIAVCVREPGRPSSGEIDLGAERSMAPASNMKLVTTAAALAALGSQWCFETRFEAQGELRDGVLIGDLVVRGGADPLFDAKARGDVDHLLAPALEELRLRGVHAIEGDLVLDEGAFAVPGPAPQWPDDDQHFTEYCALSGAFTANRGCVTARVTPSRVGEPAAVELLPRGHGLRPMFDVRTVSEGKLKISFGARGGDAIVRGVIPSSSAPWMDSFAAPDPVELFGAVLADALARRGVELKGGVRRQRHAPGGEELCVLRTPLVTYLDEINADSTNAVADQVFLAMANEAAGLGERHAGERATREALETLGVSSSGFEQIDGSGLSRGNRVSARQIVALLEAVIVSDAISGRSYLDSLAVAGRSGTLSSRMKGGPAEGRVRAKTGFINGVSALSGYVERADGRTLAFSVLVNYPHVEGLNTHCWKRMQDELCDLLASMKL